MSRTEEIEAFVLRTVDYGDSHVIVTLLGRDVGKFSAMARHAKKSRKRFGGALLPLRRLTATVSFKPHRDLANLESATVERDYPGIESSFEKITVASYATELVRCAIRDNDESNQALDLLHGCYERLSSSEESTPVLRAVLHHFELSIMSVSGASPSLHACHRCGRTVETMDRLRCGRGGHGLTCDDCVRPGERYGMLSPATLTVLHYLEHPQGRPPDAIADGDVAAQVRRVLDASLEQILDVELRSRVMLDTVLGVDSHPATQSPR